MSEFRIAFRYAKSLIDLAEEKGLLDNIFKDIQLFSQVVKENRQLELLLKNPIVGSDKKLTILKALFEKNVNKLSMAFFELVTKKKREAYLPQVADQFINLYNEIKGSVSATVVTTIPLSEDLRMRVKEIIKRFVGKEVELKEEVDKDIIGGFVLKMGDKQLDESVKSKLDALRYGLTERSYIKSF